LVDDIQEWRINCPESYLQWYPTLTTGFENFGLFCCLYCHSIVQTVAWELSWYHCTASWNNTALV
jgi:hypothetical protein